MKKDFFLREGLARLNMAAMNLTWLVEDLEAVVRGEKEANNEALWGLYWGEEWLRLAEALL